MILNELMSDMISNVPVAFEHAIFVQVIAFRGLRCSGEAVYRGGGASGKQSCWSIQPRDLWGQREAWADANGNLCGMAHTSVCPTPVSAVKSPEYPMSST